MNNMAFNKMLSNAGRIQLFSSKTLNKFQQTNFSLSVGFFDKITVNNHSNEVSNATSESTVTNEKACLQPIPKKTYGLSKVEEKDMELVQSLKEGNIFYPYNGPFERAGKIFAEDFKCTWRRAVYKMTGAKLGPLEPVFFQRHTDIVIVGGGILGLTIAFTMKEKFPNASEIIVVDKDDSFPPVSTNLGQSVVTHQLFTDEEEIPMLKYGAEFFSSFSRSTQMEDHPPFKLPYEPLGTLVLVDNSNMDQTLHRIESLKKHGIYNKILDIEMLKRKFPWLNTKDILFGSLGMSDEGVIDPWAYLKGLKSKCINMGVKFVTAEVIDFGYIDGHPLRVICKLPDGTYNSIDYAKCILACGMEALNLTEVLNSSENTNLVVKLPLQEKMRYEYCFYNPEGPGLDTPIVIDSEGTYFRREGLNGHYVAGISSYTNFDDGENDPYNVFHNKVKPFLMNRVPKFDKLKLVSGWVDLQEFCFSNETGILGCHPETSTIIYALGFSHLGLQYIPAVARAATEAIFYEEYKTIDFAPFHVENLWKKQHLEADRKRRELLEASQRISISE